MIAPPAGGWPWLVPGLGAADRWDLLLEHLHQLGWSVSLATCKPSYANPITRTVVLAPAPMLESVAVLAHEATHARQFPGGLGLRLLRLALYAGHGPTMWAYEMEAKAEEAALRHAAGLSITT